MKVISFCDKSGIMVKPWLDAGHECWIVDMQHPRGVTREGSLYRVGADMNELQPYHRWLPEGEVAFVAAFPECTHSTNSATRWRRGNGPRGAAMFFELFAKCWELCEYYERERGARWMVENPTGIVCSWCQPDHVFDPYEYGDPYTKRTCLWTGGGFVMPPKVPVALDPQTHDRIHKAGPGPERRDFRSLTPAGFAHAVFLANSPVLTPEGK